MKRIPINGVALVIESCDFDLFDDCRVGYVLQ